MNTSKNSTMNIFKNTKDCVFYILLYIIAPTAQCFFLAAKGDVGFYITALLTACGIAYDAFSRYQKDFSKYKKLSIFGLYADSFCLAIIVLVFLILRKCNVAFSNWWFLLYSIIIYPIIVSTSCLVSHILKLLTKKP